MLKFELSIIAESYGWSDKWSSDLVIILKNSACCPSILLTAASTPYFSNQFFNKADLYT